MRLASFCIDGKATYGSISGDRVTDFGPVADLPSHDLKSLLTHLSPQLLARLGSVDAPSYPISDITWLPLIPNPDKIVCVGLNYLDHLEETKRPPPAYPVLFLRLASSQVGHLQPLVRPVVSEQLDFEGEVAVIIGRSGRHIRMERALQHVAGYSIYNEASIRDWQQHTHQYTAGKNFPGTGAFGPWLVTADEIGDPKALQLVTRLNAEVMQHSSLANLIFSIEQLVAYISAITELVPGDVIVTGTPAGVGGLRQPPVWMRPGDLIEVEVSQIGRLTNDVRQES
jgi:2-keto-4-pentenoate hydratase/2-oxohepta-3-ene-1,7-dioic acid hydratase in catechol pathway